MRLRASVVALLLAVLLTGALLELSCLASETRNAGAPVAGDSALPRAVTPAAPGYPSAFELDVDGAPPAGVSITR